MKMNHPLFGHYILALSFKYLEKKTDTLFPMFDSCHLMCHYIITLLNKRLNV